MRYVYTYKVRLTELTRREYERDITAEEYSDLLARKTPNTITIRKDRHVFRHKGLTYELDVYDFWRDKATLEAEVKSEDTVYADGTGTIVFNADGSFTWHEDQSETGTDLVFELCVPETAQS